MSALDATIDDLYKLPPAEFTVARNTLARTLTKDEARLVKALEKPTVVPWAVNQVYWRARSTYDRLMKIGEKLRTAQIAALEGRAADVRAASDAHRRAISEAVAEAERLAAAAGVRPGADALARTFEALSVATTASHAPGRLTDALQPAGFEALLGVNTSEVRSQKLDVRSTKSEVRSTKPELVKAGGERRTPNHERPPRRRPPSEPPPAPRRRRRPSGRNTRRRSRWPKRISRAFRPRSRRPATPGRRPTTICSPRARR